MHCNIIDDNKIIEKTKGLVQGNAISTVLSNLYLHHLDLFMEQQEYRWIRFADNIYVYCKKEDEAIAAYNKIADFLCRELELTINGITVLCRK